MGEIDVLTADTQVCLLDPSGELLAQLGTKSVMVGFDAVKGNIGRVLRGCLGGRHGNERFPKFW
jgi:hypothetical protein